MRLEYFGRNEALAVPDACVMLTSEGTERSLLLLRASCWNPKRQSALSMPFACVLISSGATKTASVSSLRFYVQRISATATPGIGRETCRFLSVSGRYGCFRVAGTLIGDCSVLKFGCRAAMGAPCDTRAHNRQVADFLRRICFAASLLVRSTCKVQD